MKKSAKAFRKTLRETGGGFFSIRRHTKSSMFTRLSKILE